MHNIQLFALFCIKTKRGALLKKHPRCLSIYLIIKAG